MTQPHKYEYSLFIERICYSSDGAEFSHGEAVRQIPLTEEEYREFVEILRKKKAVDDAGKRIDGKCHKATPDEMDKVDESFVADL